MNIKELQQLVLEFRNVRDWKQFHNPKDLATAISIESWELQEHFLWKSQADSYDLAKKQDVADELADIFNYILLFADSADIDLEKALLEKMSKNDKKYPISKAKWKSDKYNQL
ncbi:MAG: nucleotide pyrophosphohydrolase [uncultured bacterium (gcode 4)]|uniref:Nucleotide pyrophosphohydrolase n=1 Tax=uncultured bacterium (gcode 4) TaxID=1234023 RepID=K2G2X6_9BACT|nr:MAG: nucleotide pyrophosphohydrolase [uncultured bacterium (gcode 4)]